MEICVIYGKVATEAGGKPWRGVLADRFTEGELRAAWADHQSDTSIDFDGKPRADKMPTPASIKYRIEVKRAAIGKKRFYCGDSDCFGVWRAAGPNTRSVIRCSKCEALRDSEVAPARSETYEEHIKTPEYAKAKADMEAALLRVFGHAGKGKVYYQPKAVPQNPTQQSMNERAIKLREQARELASKRADFEVKIEPGPFDQVVRVERDGDKLIATPVSEAERVEYLRQITNQDSEPEITDDDIPF